MFSILFDLLTSKKIAPSSTLAAKGNKKAKFCADFKNVENSCVKGSLTRDFRLQVFFINQCPSGP